MVLISGGGVPGCCCCCGGGGGGGDGGKQRPHSAGNKEAKEYRNISCHIRNRTTIPRLSQPVAQLQHLSVTFHYSSFPSLFTSYILTAEKINQSTAPQIHGSIPHRSQRAASHLGTDHRKACA